MDRIAKRIARSGVCSRREAEKLIFSKCVSVNGKIISSPALNVSINDDIKINGKKLPEAETTRIWKYYKPKGIIVSHSDEKNRETLFDILPQNMPRVISVGRLDFNSEGLILLTNDGYIARNLELPSNNWERKYKVRVRGRIKEEKLKKLSDGIEINGIYYKKIIARLDNQMATNSWLTITLREGKNREIRYIMDYLGYPVSRLIRISFGPFKINNLKSGEIIEIKSEIFSHHFKNI